MGDGRQTICVFCNCGIAKCRCFDERHALNAEAGSPDEQTSVGAQHLSSPSSSPSLGVEAQERSIELLRQTLQTLCDFVWHGTTKKHLWSIPTDTARDFDCILSDAIDELERRRAEARVLPSQEPRQLVEGRPPSTYHWGEPMTTYATLGIGVEAWAELTEVERRGIGGRDSRVSISGGTFVLLMRVLRAIRIEDFREAAPRSVPEGHQEHDEEA